MRAPQIEEYRALVALTDAGDVRSAAKALRCSQPRISRHLQVFKDDDGDGLLKKDGRSLVLTPRGKRLLPGIRTLLEQHDHLGLAVCQAAAPPRRLAIGTGRFEAELFLPAVAAEIQRELPDVKIRLRLLRGEQRILKTASGELDLAIVTHDEGQIHALVRKEFGDDARLLVEPLALHALHVAAHRKTPYGQDLAGRPNDKSIPLKQVARWPLHALDPDSGIRQHLEREYRDAGEEAHSFLVEGGDWHVAKAFAQAALGVAIVPEPLLRDSATSGLVSRPLDVKKLQLRTRLISRPGNSDASLATLRKLLRKGFQNA